MSDELEKQRAALPTFRQRHIITAQQFVDGGYNNRLDEDKCRVFKLNPPPPHDNPAQEAIHWYGSIIRDGVWAVLEEVYSIECKGEDFYLVRTAPPIKSPLNTQQWSCGKDEEFIVFDEAALKVGGFHRS